MLKVVHTICIPFGIENVWLCIGAHTLSEGAIEGLQVGNMFHGFIMGAVSGAGGYAINNYGQELGRVGKIASSAILGGVVSEIGGGKFANGAITAAYSMMFNEMMHPRNRLFMATKKYKSTHPQWRKDVRKKAFKYMLDYTNKTGKEIAAAVLKNGNILVFKTTGNTPTSSLNDFYDEYNGSSGTYVNVNGRLEEVAYQVHTHPYTGNNYDNPLRISFEDIDMANKRFGGTVHVLVLPGDYYKVHTNQLNAFEGPINW